MKPYTSWRADSFCKAVDALQQKWTHKILYTFLPFCLIGKLLRKVEQDKAAIILITRTWQSQSGYPTPLRMCVRNPHLLPSSNDLLQNIQEEFGIDRKVSPRCQAGFQQQLAAKRISRRAAKLVTNARRKGNQSNYQSTRNKWTIWCHQQKVDPMR